MREAVRRWYGRYPGPHASDAELAFLPFRGTLFPVGPLCQHPAAYGRSGTPFCANRPLRGNAGRGPSAPSCWRPGTQRELRLHHVAYGTDVGTETCMLGPTHPDLAWSALRYGDWAAGGYGADPGPPQRPPGFLGRRLSDGG